uniref:Uncharacterized protein n=1 Tax=Crocodylus porosus TaxID=8502 RepID=A0A7M4EMJ1_CROPO
MPLPLVPPGAAGQTYIPSSLPWGLAILVVLLLPPLPSKEIIGGWEAKPHSRPYMAFVKISGGPGQSFTCGRFLRDRLILSSLSCWWQASVGQGLPRQCRF